MSAQSIRFEDIDENQLLSFTPAMRQFVEIKQANPGLLILYRMGDFYETFFDDAETVHRTLGLTLTSRSALVSGARIPMAGIPYTTLDQYLLRLVNQGFSVGICEQIGVAKAVFWLSMLPGKKARSVCPG